MYTLSSATENVWNNLDKAYKPETISDDDIKKWPSEIMNVIEPLNGLMEKTFLSSKQFIRCDATREALESLVVFAETEKLQSSTGKDDPGHALGFLKSPYPRHLSEQLRDELSALRDREKRLENGIFGLVTWGTLPECKTPPTSDQTAKNEG
jgi:hypothetical protein